MSDGGKGSSPRPFSVSMEEYNNNFDNIFRKKTVTPRVQENNEEFGSCGCGRSPERKCCGWHSLTEQEYQERLAEYRRQQDSKE
jgi:hypothetical protein